MVNMVKLTLEIPEAILKRIELLARNHGRTIEEEAVKLICEYVDRTRNDMGAGMRTLTVTIPDAEFDHLCAIADADHVSVEDLALKVLRQYLKARASGVDFVEYVRATRETTPFGYTNAGEDDADITYRKQ